MTESNHNPFNMQLISGLGQHWPTSGQLAYVGPMLAHVSLFGGFVVGLGWPGCAIINYFRCNNKTNIGHLFAEQKVILDEFASVVFTHQYSNMCMIFMTIIYNLQG